MLRRQLYAIGAYVPTNNAPTVAHVEHVLGWAVKGVEVIIMGDLNVSLGEPHDAREEELTTAAADC